MIVPRYIQNIIGAPIPLTLFELLAFQDGLKPSLPYSDGFEVLMEENFNLKDWSAHPSFLKHLIPIAQADSLGAFYALWTYRQENIDEAPVVVFDNDGNYFVVTKNFTTLLRLITLDTEPMIDEDGIYFCQDEANYDPSPYIKKYKKWLQQCCHLSPIYNNFEAELLIEEAQNAFQTTFETWAASYITT